MGFVFLFLEQLMCIECSVCAGDYSGEKVQRKVGTDVGYVS